MRSTTILGTLLVGLAACSDNTSGTAECSANDDCDAGWVCQAGVCKRLCSSTPECAAGEVCANSFCQPRPTGAPTISALDGDGTEICPDADGSHCIAVGLRVEGTRLAAATFTLLAAAGGSWTLTPRAGVTETQVELDLPADVALGMHTLSANNGVGSVDQAFTIIQGPTGPAGSPDTAAQVLQKLVQVDGAASGLDADLLDGVEYAAIDARLTAVETMRAVPVGSIIAWHKSLTGVPALPDGWMECNGQQVTDAASPLHLQSVPDLNSAVYAGTGRGRYLRGGLISGTSSGSSWFSGNGVLYSGVGTPNYYGACYGQWNDTENGTRASYSGSDNTLGHPYVKVAAMTVVWIIRIK